MLEPPIENTPQAREHDDGVGGANCIIGCAIVVVSPILLFLALAFFVVLPPERKARRIAETQAAAFSVEQWEQIFNEAVAYHSEHYRGEGASHPAEQVVPVLAELGYSSCWLGGTPSTSSSEADSCRTSHT